MGRFIYGVAYECVNRGDVTATGTMVGGLFGVVNYGFNNCENYGNVSSTGVENVGGLAGYVSAQFDITNSTNYGEVSAPNATNVSGAIGYYADEVAGALTVSGIVNEGKVTGNQFVSGVIARAIIDAEKGGNPTFTNLVNKGEINGRVRVGGLIATMTNSTLKNSENRGTVNNLHAETTVEGYGDSLGDDHNNAAGIVANIDINAKVIQNVNYANVYNKNWKMAAGIVARVGGDNALVEGNVNYGTIQAMSNTGGIVSILYSGSNATKNTVVKGNVNYGEIINGKAGFKTGNRAGIVAWKASGASEVAYNVNFGKLGGEGGTSGSIIGTVNCNTAKLGTDVYGNIDAMKYGITNNHEAWLTNNYSVGATNRCTLIGGKPVTLDQFKFGEVADIINNLSYEADNFLATYGETVVPNNPDKYLFGANGNERPASVIFWDGNMKNLTADKFVAPIGLEADYMVQEIGVDEYPLPRLAAEIIYADREMTVPAGPATVAPAAPVTEGTEQFIGYIDYDRNIYKAGAEVNGKYLYPVSVDFYTAYGAGVRTTSPTGIRYQTLVKDNLDMLPESFVTNFGTIVLPYSYVEQMMAEANAATFNKKVDVAQIIGSGVKHINIANNGWADPTVTGVEVADGYKTYMGSLVNIKDSNLTRDFTGISYLKVTYADGEVSYITADWQTAKDGTEFVDGVSYSKDANARSIVTVAQRALNDQNAGFSDTVRAALQAYIDRAEELGLLA